MAMPLAEPFYTAEMVRALIDETRHWPRYETVHGELLVTPAPRPTHQELVLRLVIALREYLAREPVGRALISPADISWGLPDTLVQPDVFVIPRDQWHPTDWGVVRHLLLAAEIRSPGSTRADRFTKRVLYRERGVPLNWLVDPDAEWVEVWTPADVLPRVERDIMRWHPEGAREAFELSVPELFREM